MSAPIVLITGGNTGLGLEVIKALLRSGTAYNLIIGCRSPSKGDEAIGSLQQEFSSQLSSSGGSALSVVQVDLESDESIYAARDTLTTKFGRLDVLINNGGAGFDRQLQEGEMGRRETWLKTWDVNVAGTMVLTHELVPLLLKSSDSRLLFITSGTSTLTESERLDNPAMKAINGAPEAGWPKKEAMNPVTIYRSAKTGLNMAVREWDRILRNDGVKVWAVSPGFLATGLRGVGAEQLKKVSCRIFYPLDGETLRLTRFAVWSDGSFDWWRVYQGCRPGQAGSGYWKSDPKGYDSAVVNTLVGFGYNTCLLYNRSVVSRLCSLHFVCSIVSNGLLCSHPGPNARYSLHDVVQMQLKEALQLRGRESVVRNFFGELCSKHSELLHGNMIVKIVFILSGFARPFEQIRGKHAHKHLFCGSFADVAHVELKIHAPRSNQCRIKLLRMICGHDHNSAFLRTYAVKNIEQA